MVREILDLQSTKKNSNNRLRENANIVRDSNEIVQVIKSGWKRLENYISGCCRKGSWN